ncbi:MAG: hypothetical protein AAF092_06560 [Pseudomonadota bacterium]
MARTTDTYSRIVGTLKVLLPLAALGALSTLFIFSGEVDPSQSLPYVELNVEELAARQRISAPYFAGVNEDGTAITIVGDAVAPNPDDPDLFTVEAMRAAFETQDARTMTALAPQAVLDTGASTALFSGGTEVVTSAQLELRTDSVRVNLSDASLESLGPIEATGPFGQVTADQMILKRPESGGAHMILLNGNVRVEISPNRR